MEFKLYFFKDKTQSIDFKQVFAFFEEYPECSFKFDDDFVDIDYFDETLGNKARFSVTRKSNVPNIYKLNPKYANLNFHLELPSLVPKFKSDIIFEMIRKLSLDFTIFMYCEFFENILPYRMEVASTAYQYFKKAYKETVRGDYNRMVYVEKDKLEEILRYHAENKKLRKHYEKEEIETPQYTLLLDQDSRQLFRAVEWEEGTKTIFPPNLDFVIYRPIEGDLKMYKYQDLVKDLGKLFYDLPGFIKGTKILDDPAYKKADKIMYKNKFIAITRKYEKVDVTRLIDI